jgi:hypothetical protein
MHLLCSQCLRSDKCAEKPLHHGDTENTENRLGSEIRTLPGSGSVWFGRNYPFGINTGKRQIDPGHATVSGCFHGREFLS